MRGLAIEWFMLLVMSMLRFQAFFKDSGFGVQRGLKILSQSRFFSD